MLKKSLMTIGLGLLVFVASAVSLAELPSTIHYRGFLTTKSNDTPANGNFNITFSLYPAAIGGTASWTEIQSVTVTNGTFSVELGAGTAFPADLFANQLYLDISVAGESMDPRLKLTSVPYAFVAGVGDNSSSGGEQPNFMDDDGDGEIDEGFNRIFVTSQTFSGNLGGAAGADAKCQAAAEATGSILVAGRQYKALISTSSGSIVDRLSESEKSDNPYYNTNNELVFDNFADFFDGDDLHSPIRYDENGSVSTYFFVFTGTGPTGLTSTTTCNDFSSDSTGALGKTGLNTRQNQEWVHTTGDATCSGGANTGLYCIEVGASQ